MFQVELPVEIDAEVYAWLVAKRGEAVSVADARAKMQAALTGFLHRTASRLAAKIRAFGDEHGKMEKASYSVEAMLANLLPIEWDSLIPDMARSLRAAAQAGGAHALVGLRVDDASMLSDVNRVAAEWADDRAAEMVGRKYVNGKLVDNPNAEWVISDYTREQLKSIITEAFKAKTSMRELADEVEQAGVFSESRAEMIARTEIARAENRGNLTGWKQSGLVELIDWQLSADHDDSSNCSCSDYAEAGPYELDDVPEFPAHPNCFLAGTHVAAKGVAAQTMRWYTGEIIILRISGVQDIAVTPNHPILTRRGWVAAGSLDLLDDLVQCLSPAEAIALIDPHDDYIEASIEQVADALLVAGGVSTRGVPVAAEAFHGDVDTQSKIDIVRPAGTVMYDLSVSGKFSQYHSLRFTQDSLMPFVVNSAAAQLIKAADHSANRVMCGSDVSCADRSWSVGVPNLRGFDHASLLQAQDIPVSDDGDAGDSYPCSDTQDRLAALVCFVKLVEIDRRQFSGHVYNLQTRTELYCANTIVAHNCWCSLTVAQLVGQSYHEAEED